MRLLSVSLLFGGLATLVHAASFADLAAQLPACACVATNCTVKESLTLVRVQNLACGVAVPSQQNKFKINAVVACVLAEICVILRIFSKLRIMGKLGMDDYCILVAGFATIPYLYLHWTLADLGFGLNIWDIQPFGNLYELLKRFWIDQMLYSLHLYSTKISILYFLSSIFTSPLFRKITTGMLIFVAVSGAATLITTGLQCLPASYNWTGWDGEHVGHCNNLNSQTYAFGAINMVCDLAILIMPLPELYKLQVKGRQKIQLFVMFSLGIIVTVFSVIRLPFLITLGKTSNPTWDYVEVTIWSIWETELGMICASLPAIRHLFKHMWPNALSTIAAKMSSFSRTGDTGTDKSGSWSGSRKDRSNVDNNDYHELDERSLIGKGQDGASATAVQV
ncbi:hypothetical protein BKA56DRAFT_490607 [Ilyonectria sp. MPI-CAGE-AT-0026]|nr:hypothetical protein BKA56DRAFT_490607 [Ilyonectria sp. MPI-CAGE-AT-0026]